MFPIPALMSFRSSNKITIQILQRSNSSLVRSTDTKEIFLYSPAYDIEYNEDDIIERVSNELNAEINNIFVDGDKYCAAIYFTVKKLEQ